jgi:hypothetical protein
LGWKRDGEFVRFRDLDDEIDAVKSEEIGGLFKKSFPIEKMIYREKPRGDCVIVRWTIAWRGGGANGVAM